MQTLVVDKNGSVRAANLRKLDEFPFFLVPNRPNNAIGLAAYGTGDQVYSMAVSGEGPAKVYGLSLASTSVFKVKLLIAEGDRQRYICNTAIHSGTVFGTGQLPYPFPEELYIDELRQLFLEVSDLSGAANTLYPVAVGSRVTSEIIDPTLAAARKRQNDKQFISVPYFYTFDDGSATLTANQSIEKVITISPESHFWLRQLSYASTGRFSIDIIDANKGESLISAPQGTHYNLPADLILGSNIYPYTFSEPVLVMTKQQILVKITDLSGSANTVYLTLGGRALADRMWS